MSPTPNDGIGEVSRRGRPRRRRLVNGQPVRDGAPHGISVGGTDFQNVVAGGQIGQRDAALPNSGLSICR
jgi:hypothetical protein